MLSFEIFSFGAISAFLILLTSNHLHSNWLLPFFKYSSRGLRVTESDLVIMGGEEGLGVTTGQPNLYKQDLSKLVSKKYTYIFL